MKPWLQVATPALSGALTAAAAGFAVAPCHVTFRPSDNKKIITSGSLAAGWQTKPGADAEQIRMAFANGANAYLIACGPSGIVVADLDVRSASGIESWQGKQPGGLIVATPSGGRHHYYRNDSQVGCPASGIPGVDIKGIGGGVFGPGSLDGAYQVLHSEALPLWSALGLTLGSPAKPAAQRGFFDGPDSISAESADRSISAELTKVTEHAHTGWAGFRSTLMRAAYVLGGYVGSDYLTYDRAVAELLAAISSAGHTPDTDDRRWIDQGLEDGAAKPLTVRPFVPESAAARTIGTAGSTNLPAGFWAARPLLGHIRAAAHSRGRCPDAVLGVRLAKLASLIPGGVRADSGLATPTPLSYYTLLYGTPDTGKSSAAELGESEDFFEDGTDRHPLGSGQGIAAAYGEIIEGIFNQTRHNALFYRDEAAALFDSKRNDVVLSALREAWSGRPFGQKNANDERNRYIRNYSIGLWVGLQPVHVTKLLAADNVGDGTLQRFVFFNASDPAIPRTRAPVQYSMPPINRAFLASLTNIALTVPEWLKDDLWDRAWQRSSGTVSVSAGDEHADLRRLRTALLLAVEDQRYAPDATDWELAGAVMACHSEILASARRTTAAMADQAARSRVKRDIEARHATLDADEAREERKIEALVLKVVEKVSEKPGWARTLLVKAFRDRGSADTAITLAAERGLVKVQPASTQGETVWPGDLQ